MRLAVSVMTIMRQQSDHSLRNQMIRSAISVPSNIAEGYERRTNREFIRFLRIAGGSNAELRTQLYLARATEQIEHDLATKMIDQTQKVSAQLINLIRHRKSFDKPS
jgi:four helix bundle protein